MKSDEAECADAQQAASATMVVRTLVGVHGRSYLRIDTTVQCGAVTEIPKLLGSEPWLEVMDRGQPCDLMGNAVGDAVGEFVDDAVGDVAIESKGDAIVDAVGEPVGDAVIGPRLTCREECPLSQKA